MKTDNWGPTIYGAGEGRPPYGPRKTRGRWKHDSRVAISILWFEREDEADLAGKQSREKGNTYNGGWFHGMPCGRETHRDYTDKEGTRWYAVTF